MAGLKGANAVIGDDGVSVTVKTESEATARELAAHLETQVRTAEGGPGAKFNSWLKKSLDRFDETLGLYGDRSLNIIRDVLLICAMAMAAFAWYRVLPGYEILMCVIGMAIVYAMKYCAGRLDKAIVSKNGFAPFYGLIIVVGLIIEVLASSSLQAFTAVEQETGRLDIDKEISRLENERNMLQINLARVPSAPASAIDQRIEALKLTPAVNSSGTQLTKRVGDLVGDCKGRSYYVTIYCPTLIELQAERDSALAYEQAKARFDEINPEINALTAKRPHTSSTFALASKASGGDVTWWMSLVIPVGLTLALGLAMLLLSYLAGRAERTPDLELNDPITGAPGGSGP